MPAATESTLKTDTWNRCTLSSTRHLLLAEVEEAFAKFQGEPQKLKLPSAPQHPIIVRKELNRPQPRFDRDAGQGMSVTVGRIRSDPILTMKYMCLGHNTIRGAAGGGILSAELAVAKGLA